MTDDEDQDNGPQSHLINGFYAAQPGSVVTSMVTIVEYMDANGEQFIDMFCQDGQHCSTTSGLLRYGNVRTDMEIRMGLEAID